MWEALTQVQYHLLETPEYIGPLRQEVEVVVAEEGRTKAGLDKLHKLDSFIRETMRVDQTRPPADSSVSSCVLNISATY